MPTIARIRVGINPTQEDIVLVLNPNEKDFTAAAAEAPTAEGGDDDADGDEAALAEGKELTAAQKKKLKKKQKEKEKIKQLNNRHFSLVKFMLLLHLFQKKL